MLGLGRGKGTVSRGGRRGRGRGRGSDSRIRHDERGDGNSVVLHHVGDEGRGVRRGL